MSKLKAFAFHATLSVLLAMSLLPTAGTAAAEAVRFMEPHEPLPQDTAPNNANNNAATEKSKPHCNNQGFRGGHIVKDTADLLGMDPKTLLAQLHQGKTLLQITQDRKGWSEAEYIQKLTVTIYRNIDKAIAAGKLDQNKAAKIKAGLPEKLSRVIKRPWKQHPPGYPTNDYHNNQVQWHPISQ
ncbi:hypothetical protein ACFQ3W_17380 [Paenibacillus puldeungensis]|uniref:Uncharacterized protein n=1 Tax=Paenibacillus puldeungensis TaxID=696536 RepID=A0ABW3S0P3_9BACL